MPHNNKEESTAVGAFVSVLKKMADRKEGYTLEQWKQFRPPREAYETARQEETAFHTLMTIFDNRHAKTGLLEKVNELEEDMRQKPGR